jgi:hypothetical protein
VAGKRGARLVEGLDDTSIAVLDRNAFGGERTVAVRRAERAVRHTLFVQARRDDDIVEDSCPTLDRPEHAPLTQACRDLVELVPALQATVGLEHGLE